MCNVNLNFITSKDVYVSRFYILYSFISFISSLKQSDMIQSGVLMRNSVCEDLLIKAAQCF